jgi:stress response protein SCP2
MGDAARYQALHALAEQLGKITGCTVSNVDDGAGTGTLSYSLSGGSSSSLVVDYTLIDENGASRINAQHPRSNPALTLTTYCNALVGGDYQTAYSQLSSTAQGQETEAQFAANFNSIKITQCAVSNVNDTAGTGMITYTLGDGRTAVLYYTLVNENGAWKINSEQTHP